MESRIREDLYVRFGGEYPQSCHGNVAIGGGCLAYDEAQEKFLAMDEHIRQKDKELATIETKLAKAKQDYEPYKAQEELNLVHELFPMMKEQLRIAEFCRKIGLTVDHIRRLLRGNTLIINVGKLFSPEHKQHFEVRNAAVKIESEPNAPNKLQLNINGINILDWFKDKYQEVHQKFDIGRKPEMNKSKGFKM